MGNLYGTYRVTLDVKRRLAVPAKLRYAFPDGLRNQIFITRGIEKCITGYHYEEWQKFQTILNKLKIDETSKRKIKRQFLGRASEEVFDKQGRIILPDDLVSFAELENSSEVMIIGTGNTLEIWNPRIYQEDGAASEEIIQKTMGSISLDLDDFYTPDPN
jgi:MraZ protein